MLFAPTAWADNGTDNSTDSAANDTSQSQNQQTKSADKQPTETLTIAQITPVVTASSGFHMQVVVANTTTTDAPSGTLDVSINALFTFASRTDMQSWAENGTGIPTPNPLGSVHVPAIAAGQSATVSLDVQSDNQTLTQLRSWGPKPLRLSYTAGDTHTDLHSFLTRSSDGLQSAQTPAMNLTVAMPLTANDWQVNNTAVKHLIEETDSSDDGGTGSADGSAQSESKPESQSDAQSGSNQSKSTQGSDANTSSDATAAQSSSTSSSNLLSLSEPSIAQAKTVEQAVAKHPKLQVVADPVYVQESGSTAAIAGIMQPADFDITAYAAINDASAYTNAGVSDAQWTAKNAQTIYAVATKTASNPQTYAWQGSDDWSMDALAKARAQGYSTVIATASFDNAQTDTVHTGTYTVNTSAGDITVLKEQSELSTLAHGYATSKSAAAETSDAGRLSRLIAQSAFYQMEQPYTTRNLLMTFTRSSSAEWINQVMSALEQSPWLNLTDLQTMATADPYTVSDSVNQNAADQDTSATRSILDRLAASRSGITRLASSILKNGVTSDDIASLDPQALARRDADSTANHSNDPKQWLSGILAAHDSMALRALTGTAPSTSHERMADTAQQMTDTLLNSISITPSESVSVFSESAQMPVTVSNALPYAVKVQVNSITDSMQIVTSRTNTVSIPAHSEAQVAFTIRVSTSGSATARVSLADRQGNAFGGTQNTAITSVLRISDASGFIIIGFAALLGVVGLWRQFNRKKDPDE
ncbi:hypothetical protein JS530_02410 [Bifidobacterium sp. LC6]|uniref:Secreted protein n=1 Tax=Bifidobacterium colobi TaxID=2809026 RepID=A0ABS5UVC7_9BIFI|nr:DUF6049 family protein [Bifidobacterium colobi]MBT1174373.1 hypothetical protein [Bifidobacterium colobi]